MAKVNATIFEGGATFTASVTSVAVLSNIIGWDPIDAFETSPADFILSLKNIVLEGWATLTTDMRITAWRDQDPAVAVVDAAPTSAGTGALHWALAAHARLDNICLQF